MIGGDVSFWYPPEWLKKDESSVSVELVRADGDTIGLMLEDAAQLRADDYRAKIEFIKTVMIDANSVAGDWDITFSREGEFSAAYSPVYVAASRQMAWLRFVRYFAMRMKKFRLSGSC